MTSWPQSGPVQERFRNVVTRFGLVMIGGIITFGLHSDLVENLPERQRQRQGRGSVARHVQSGPTEGGPGCLNT